MSAGSDQAHPAGGDGPLALALLALTASTGLVDAVSYLGLGRVFTANMTGNVVLLGFALAGIAGLSVVRSGVALAAFLVGAVVGGRLGAALGQGPRRPTPVIRPRPFARLRLAVHPWMKAGMNPPVRSIASSFLYRPRR